MLRLIAIQEPNPQSIKGRSLPAGQQPSLSGELNVGDFIMFKPRCCDAAECCFWGTLATVLLVVFGLIVFVVSQICETPHYSVAIDSASGLDPAVDLGRPTVDPEFNLTLGVASRAFMGGQCLPSGAEVQVWYRGVLLAASGPTRQTMCAAARKAAQEPALALGTGVRLPGFVRDSLAADMRRGVQRFAVTMRFGNGEEENLVPCGSRQVGDVVASASPILCDG